MTTLALVVTGAPLAARAHDIAAAAAGAGWTVSVHATSSALSWLDAPQITAVTGQQPHSEQRDPSQPKAPRPAAAAVCPATFNTVNKLAAGVADNPVTSLLCECIGARIPLVAVPMVNRRLWGHPAWEPSLTRLRHAGVVFVDVRTGGNTTQAVPSGTGEQVTRSFDPSWMLSALPPPT